MLPAILRRPASRRFKLLAAVALVVASSFATWRLSYSTDIDLDINGGAARRPLVAVQGKVTQMPAGDYLAANTLVDTSACSSTNVIAWNGTQFACAAAGGGGSGGGISNTAPNHVLTVSDGTNVGSSSISDDGAKVQVAHSGTIPLQVTGMGSNVWDISPMIGSNVDPATVTMFAQAVTTMPSVDSTLNFHLIAGTGGAGGVNLSPNGANYMDPDGYAQHGHILAIGFLTPQYELDVRDPGNHHTTSADCVANTGSAYECIVISGKGASDFIAGTGSDTEYIAVNGEALGSRASGTAQVINIGLHGRASGGQANWSLLTEDGDACIGCTGSGAAAASGSVNIKRPLTVTSASPAFSGGGTTITGTSPYGLSVGPTSDDTYITNGNIAYGYNINSTDHLTINGIGYLGSTGQFRDLFIDDGELGRVATFTGASKTVDFSGAITTVGNITVNTNKLTVSASTGNVVAGGTVRINGASGPVWNSGAAPPSGACNVGDLYSNTAGSTSTTLYVCTASATWTAKFMGGNGGSWDDGGPTAWEQLAIALAALSLLLHVRRWRRERGARHIGHLRAE